MENFPLEYPNSRQVRFAALCGICTATFVFAIAPLVFQVLYRLSKWLFGPIVQFDTVIGIICSTLAFIFRLAGPIVIFLYLDKKQPTGPLCFWVNLFSQFLVLRLFCVPLMRINGFLGWFADLTYFVHAVAWSVAVVLVQWGISLYLRHRQKKAPKDAQSPCGEERSPKTGVRLRRIFCILLLLPLLVQAVLNRIYYPYLFYHYLNVLPDPKACQVEVTYGEEGKWQLDETQRAELFVLMKELKYDYAYGPFPLPKAEYQTPYNIHIYPSDGNALRSFLIRHEILDFSGFYDKIPILPGGYWLTVQDTFEIFVWLEHLSGDD